MRALLILYMCLSLAACVTEVSGQREKDLDKAVSDRISAGMQYLQLGKPAEAQRHLARALEINDDSAEAHNAMALFYRYEGDMKKEEYHLKKALRSNSAFGPAQNNYGALLMRQDNVRKALKYFNAAAENIDYDARAYAYTNSGMAYRRLGDNENAQKSLSRALRLAPEAALPKLELAELAYEQENFKVADFYYNQYVGSVSTQEARGLWLGIRLAANDKSADRQASYELALQKLYPQSPEFRAWQKWKAQGDSQ